MRQDPGNTWRMGDVKTIGYCTFCVVLVGFVLLIAGAIISGIAFTEVRPNIADENFDRYIKANLNRIVGPIMLAFGLLCLIGGCVFFGINLYSASSESRRRSERLKYNVRASEEHLPATPDFEKKYSDV